jgi:hypothetical protein
MNYLSRNRLKCICAYPESSSLIAGAFLAMFLCVVPTSTADAYPEFQTFIEKHSGRPVNCAMCHVNGNGPTGDEPGQIGGLNAEQIALLSNARSALEPGVDVQSPILNEFGNKIINVIGKKKFLEIKSQPEKLASALGDKSDLDGDGIPDSQEYLDGTDVLNKFNGDPLKLFFVNLDRYKMHVILAAVAVFLIDFGLAHWLKAMAIISKIRASK